MTEKKRKEQIFLNGKFIDAKEPAISVFDRGLLYGDGLFETIRSYNGRPFMLKGHLERLSRGASFLGIPASKIRGLEGKVKKLIEINGLTKKSGRIRITLTRGVDKEGYKTTGKKFNPTLIITAVRLKHAPILRMQKTGVSIITINPNKGFSSSGLSLDGVKSLNFLSMIMASKYAEDKGVFEAILTNEEGHLIEGTSSNIFIFDENKLITPPVSRSTNRHKAKGSALPGITRETVIKIAKENKIKVKEANFTTKDLTNSAEAFLTNSIIEIVPINEVNEKKIFNNDNRPITAVLQEAYKNLVI
ncbi:MAG: aminotransferase class IV [Deltaproteobacteria bacterium]|nr:aminotransferase class IV [Deltaproteobacteria bacterium]